MARIISDRLGAVLGQSIVIENRGGGAGGSNGAKVVAAADPDGYTILLTPGGIAHDRPGRAHATSATTRPRCSRRSACSSRRRRSCPCNPDVPVKIAARARGLRQGQSRQADLGLAGLRHRVRICSPKCSSSKPASTSCTCPIAGQRPMLAAILAGEVQMIADAEHHQPAAHPGRQAAPAGGRR